MENLPQETEKIEKFNFPEIERMEKPMVELCSRLKENLENGKYDTLLSDDVGGRIPTLVIADILRRINPDKKFSTNFIAAGSQISLLRKFKNQEYFNYLRKIPPHSKILLITQYAHSGVTLGRLRNDLEEIDQNDVDFAVLRSLRDQNRLEEMLDRPVFLGEVGVDDKLDSKQNHFTGIAKSLNEPSPSPQLLIKRIDREGREGLLTDEEANQIFGINDSDKPDVINEKFQDAEASLRHRARLLEPLSEEERKEIQENIIKTRADVKILANLVLRQVWNREAEKSL